MSLCIRIEGGEEKGFYHQQSSEFTKCLPPGLTSTLASSAMACLREMVPTTSTMEAGNHCLENCVFIVQR